MDSLRVAVNDVAPLVIFEGDGYTGFEIELWEAIAKNINREFRYERRPFKEIVPLLADASIDVGLGGITITERREKRIDFSYPMLDSGLLISVRNRGAYDFFDTARSIGREAGAIIRSAGAWVVLFVLVFGNLLWFAERGANTFSDTYVPGIFESFWLVICSMSTDSFGDYVPHTWLGRIITTFVIIGGVAIFGLLIAEVTAALAIKRVKGDINNSRDLKGKTVATVESTTSEAFLKKTGATVVPFSTISEAYSRLHEREVDAVVFDAPVVLYHEKNEPAAIAVVGELFDKQKYGIAIPEGSPLQEEINRAFLKIKESGQYDVLYRKWFGEDLLMEV